LRGHGFVNFRARRDPFILYGAIWPYFSTTMARASLKLPAVSI
jgi:hypothetical protein